MKKKISGFETDCAHETAYFKCAGSKWEIDLDAIQNKLATYIDKEDKAKKYSISDLCIHLGITRDTLAIWRMGYVCEADFQDARIISNKALAECIAKAELYVHRYWEECEESKLQTKHTKFLESAGLFEKARRSKTGPPFDLGGLGKYAK